MSVSPSSLSLVRKASRKSLSWTCVPRSVWGHQADAGPVTKKPKCARQWDSNRKSVWSKTRGSRGLVSKC